MKAKSKAKPVRKAPASSAVAMSAKATEIMKGERSHKKELAHPMMSFRATPAFKAALVMLSESAEHYTEKSVGSQINKAVKALLLTADSKKRLPAALVEKIENNGGRSYGYY